MDPAAESLIRELQRGRLRLVAYIRSLVGDPDLTEDVFQEVSVIVLQKAKEFEPGRDFAAWCRGIARNVVHRERSRARRLRPFDDERLVDLVDAAFSEHAAEDPLERERSLLHRCLGQLAPASRAMLEERYAGGRSLRDLAARLSRTEGAVQVALSRIRKALLNCIRHPAAPGLESSAPSTG